MRSLPLLLVVFSLGLAACTVAATPPGDEHAAPGASGAPAAAGASVLLYADMSEANASCGCGKIIRMVRGAKDRGVAVREVSTENPGDVAKRYKITVSPTVLILDPKGEPTARHEGEGSAVIAALSADLDRLAKPAKP